MTEETEKESKIIREERNWVGKRTDKTQQKGRPHLEDEDSIDGSLLRMRVCSCRWDGRQEAQPP